MPWSDWQFWIDVGGTFTDLVYMEPGGGNPLGMAVAMCMMQRHSPGRGMAWKSAKR